MIQFTPRNLNVGLGSIATVLQPRVAAQHLEADSFERTPIRWLRLEILLSSRVATRLLSHRGNHIG
jgi:hypothetical protein